MITDQVVTMAITFHGFISIETWEGFIIKKYTFQMHLIPKQKWRGS